jgi:hypothetical protein
VFDSCCLAFIKAAPRSGNALIVIDEGGGCPILCGLDSVNAHEPLLPQRVGIGNLYFGVPTRYGVRSGLLITILAPCT